MQHFTLVTKQLSLAIDFSQYFSDHGCFVDTVEHPSDCATKIQQKNSSALFWDLSSFPWDASQPELTKLREQFKLPITLIGASKPFIAAFAAGIDDVLTLPLDFETTFARLQQRMRLYQPTTSPSSQQPIPNHKIILDDVTIDRQKYKAFKHGQDLGLTPKELKLLIYLVEQRPRVLSRQQLLAGVWGDIYDISQTSRMVDMHISHLRDKIEPNPKQPTRIKTVRGFGYHFVGNCQEI
ncbi:winged helix-turn-helix domain-containing protein [Fructilactobacillus florum]|uniref:Alkaline phosphatase synthesis transcriptional regulatory protein PhoP n=1 Tax=Fructilactobacillus florum DSM 22689 = JCM 16035 TaxID=1423745 RepID=A0A0R2CL81_9LACO|nr:response regulator transcription factor [Fructilactobacillus florum]KRM92360.1 alkaline phosphatase synthesis transcriptional regulatory protein PhoP [Fructilactobacillus florum DSM 22689 = JCM 16035]